MHLLKIFALATIAAALPTLLPPLPRSWGQNLEARDGIPASHKVTRDEDPDGTRVTRELEPDNGGLPSSHKPTVRDADRLNRKGEDPDGTRVTRDEDPDGTRVTKD
jgi:hypothetical protein